METPEQYWGQHTVNDRPFTTAKESEVYNKWLYEYYPMSRELLMLDRDYKGQVVLDYGCGPGNDTVEFASRGAVVLAVDISQKALDLAKQRAKACGLLNRVVFQKIGPDGKVRARDCSVNHANCNGVLHHIPDPRSQIDEMYRLLCPGRFATLMVYNRDSVFYHLYIAYVMRFLSPEQSGIELSGKFFPTDTPEYVFARTTDGYDCPYSITYGSEFMDLLPGRVYYGGAFYCCLDLKDFFDKFFWMAISERRLEREHKEFLSRLEWRDDKAYLNGMPSGALGVYYMVKDK